MTDAGHHPVRLVPHTHWDREWYEPFQRFRLKLVDVLDGVLARAEEDPRFRFTLDGQLAALEDYLEVRPEAADRVRALVASGRLAIGPWQILLDEFLCSGETIVRNLEAGHAGAQSYGGAMPVGYLPDMFGHIAQMPQILARAGLRHACVWRGVPHAVDRHAFCWEAPDGSAVRAEYLPDGYGNAAMLLADPDVVGTRAEEFAARMRPWFGADPILAMYGTDHSAPLPTLTRLVGDLAAGDTPVRLELATLAQYLADADPDAPDLPRWRGELRSHARANLLPGVLSARVHLKRAMAAAERMVARYAEPLAALWETGEPGGTTPRYLRLAWSRLIASSGHDSVTGCGADETAEQVAARLAEAEQLGQAVRDRVVAGLAARVPSEAVLVVNPSPAARSGLVRHEVVVPEQWAAVSLELPDGTRVPAQEMARRDRRLLEQHVPASALAGAVLRRTFGQRMFERRVVSYEVHPEGTTPSVTFHVSPAAGNPAYDVHAAAAHLDREARARPGEWLLRILDAPARTLAADVPVPPLGWAAVRPVEGVAPTRAPQVALDPTRGVLDNGLVRVSVNADGTLRVAAADGTVLDGVGRLVDGGDAGDTYNYAPPPRDVLVDTPVAVAMTPEAAGPVLGALRVRRAYRWPLELTPDRTARAGDGSADVDMRVELRTGEAFVRLTVGFDNHCLDHRVRLHVPLARPTRSSHAEGQFAVVERGLAAEGGCGELPVPTFPAYSFVDAGGTAVLLDHATEYELVDGGRVLALTLLRATGQISRNVHAWRESPAGPQVPTPRAQCRGPVSTRIGVLPHAGGWERDGVPLAAERFGHDLLVAGGTGPAGQELRGAAGLEVGGHGVVMTSLRERDGWLELRVVAQTDSPTTAVVRGGIARARHVDLLNRPGEEIPTPDGRLELPLNPWEIRTVSLSRVDSSAVRPGAPSPAATPPAGTTPPAPPLPAQ